MIGILQVFITLLLLILLIALNLSYTFMLAITVVAGLFGYQQWLIYDRDRSGCFQAFLNNGWVGGVIWFGLMAGM